MNSRRLRIKLLWIAIPYMMGMILLYLLPFGQTLYYAMIKSLRSRRFYGLNHFFSLFRNRYFRLAVGNTVLFTLAGTAVLLILGLLLAVFFREWLEKAAAAIPLLGLLLVPTSALMSIWHQLFPVNLYTASLKGAAASYLYFMLPVYLLYFWKNAGLILCVLLNAFSRIPDEVTQAARLETGRPTHLYRFIYLPMLKKELLGAVGLGAYQALHIFRESYLFYQTYYPPEAVYDMPYFLNNHFMKMEYPLLAAATLIMIFLILLLVAGVSFIMKWDAIGKGRR